MSGSDSSPLSSAASTEDEAVADSVSRRIGLEKYFKPAKPESPPPPKRPASPPHEYVLADNPDIAFIVMFRERFSDVFPKSLPHYGPQEIERGVTDIVPGDHIERLLCALVGLVLNRKKDVERGHYQRALEEAVQTHSSQWPRSWQGQNPLQGGKTFAAMTPEERLGFLRALILWALASSEAVQHALRNGYKQARHGKDRFQPLAVQPWGQDTWKRRYWLIEGRDDTHFRLYRESNPALKNNTWWSVAGTIEEIKSVAESLGTEKSRNAKELSKKIFDNIPRFEGSEEKRKRRDYRLARKAAFSRPEGGVSLYEGRTRGKRIKYTFSDDEGGLSSDAIPSRRSTRVQSGVSTPAETGGSVVTASGRQVRSRVGGTYGESMLSGRRPETSQEEGGEGPNLPNDSSRRTRASGGSDNWTQPGNHIEGYNSIDMMDDEPEAASSGDDYDAADGEDNYGDDDEEMSGEQSMDEEDMDIRPSLMVHLRYGKEQQTANQVPYPSLAIDTKGDELAEEKALPDLLTVAHAVPPLDPRPEPQQTNGFNVGSISTAGDQPGTANAEIHPKDGAQVAKDTEQFAADHYSEPPAPIDPSPVQQAAPVGAETEPNDGNVA